MRALSSEGYIEASDGLRKKLYLEVRMHLKSSASGSWNYPGCWWLVDLHTLHPPTTLLPALASLMISTSPWTHHLSSLS